MQPSDSLPTTKEAPFAQRVLDLPRLGIGISTEFGAGRKGLDLEALHSALPNIVQFLEIGADLERGIDDDARAWAAAGRGVTYHFLDVNLEEPEDLDEEWVLETAKLARSVDAAWLCGDAGLWHVGPRDRGHGTLMPPVLEPESAKIMAGAVRELRTRTGFEVLPENPPAHVFAGHMHLCEYFGRVAEDADSGLLIDVAHLAVFQHVRGYEPLDGLDDLPLERIVEIHVAGGTPFEHAGSTFIDDDHGVEVLPSTWKILEELVPRAENLRALVFEGERNSIHEVVPVFERLARTWPKGCATGA